MFETLINILQGIWSEEKLELINRAAEVFELYNYDTAAVAVDLTLKQASSSPGEDVILRIMSIIEENIDILILNHTVQLNSATIQEKLFILETISMLEDIDDQERLYYLATDDMAADDSRERFVAILEFVSGVSRHVFEHSIWSVHDSLVDRIGELANAKLNSYDYDIMETPSLERIQLFKDYITKNGRAVMETAILMGYRMNVNYEFILDRFQKDLSGLEPTDPKQAAVEIVGLLIMSDVPLEDIRVKANVTVSKLYTSPAFKTSTLSLMGAVLSEVGING